MNQITQHYLSQILQHTNGPIKESIERQQHGFLQLIDKHLNTGGPELATQWANSLVALSNVYDGRLASVNDIASALSELQASNISTSSPEFRKQVSMMSDRNLFRSFKVDEDGVSTPLDGSDENILSNDAPDHKGDLLREALKVANDELRQIETYGNGSDGDASVIRTRIGRIQSELGISPETPSPQSQPLSSEQLAAFRENLGGHGMSLE